MNKSLSILIGLAIIALGVWVYKTRTPVVLTPEGGVGTTSSTPPSASTLASPAVSQSPQRATSASNEASPPSELDRILATLKGPDQRKLLILDEILKSKNDNDPRLDSEFKTLTPELKRAMTQYYKSIPDEQRNERGTLAFLYTRAMNTPQDMEFVTSVMMEKACLSLADCSKAPASGGDREHEHLEGIEDTTANYPQLTAVRQTLQRYNSARGENPPNEALARAIIEGYQKAAQDSANPRIQAEAAQVLKYLGKQK